MRLSHGFCKYVSSYLISSHYNRKWPGRLSDWYDTVIYFVTYSSVVVGKL